MEKKLTEFFSVYTWPDDPNTEEGKKYFETTLEKMNKLIENEWIKELVKKKKIRILEICAGCGFGSLALVKLIKNCDYELVLTDLRKESLKKAERFAVKVIGKKIKTKVIDAREVHKLKEKFDLILLYGFSTPHFNPWDFVKLLSSVNETLKNDGIFVVEEMDRRSEIFLKNNYQYVFAQGKEGNFCISFHLEYDAFKGVCKRLFTNLSSKPVIMDIFFWSLAEILALMWLFFKELDVLKLETNRYFILGRYPRGKVKPEDLKEPSFINK